jgi:hypothetical protein
MVQWLYYYNTVGFYTNRQPDSPDTGSVVINLPRSKFFIMLFDHADIDTQVEWSGMCDSLICMITKITIRWPSVQTVRLIGYICIHTYIHLILHYFLRLVDITPVPILFISSAYLVYKTKRCILKYNVCMYTYVCMYVHTVYVSSPQATLKNHYNAYMYVYICTYVRTLHYVYKMPTAVTAHILLY